MSDKLYVMIPAGIVMAIALMTTAPGLAWLDAGDFVVAARTLGVPHPTGFPVYTMLGHLVTYLPLGNIASRLALFSAVVAGITALCLFDMVGRYARSAAERTAVALVLIVVFFGAPAVFLSCRVPEVYALNCALAIACTWCIERYWATADWRFGYGLAVLAGLGLANHALFRIWTPVFVLALVSGNPRPRGRVVLWWIGLLFLSLAAYLYLPAAALGEPVHNWGDPSSLSRFWDHVTAREIRNAFQNQMSFSLFAFQVNGLEYVVQLWSALGPVSLFGAAACVSGIVRAGFMRPAPRVAKLTVLVACLVAADGVYSVAVNPMGLRDYQNGQLSILLLAAAGAVFLSRLLVLLAARMRRFSAPIAWSSVWLLPLSLLPFSMHPFHGMDRDWTLEDLMVVQTSLAEPGSMTVLVSDSLIAAGLYVDTVLDARPDAAVFGRNQLANGRRFAYTARRTPFPIVEERALRRWESMPPMVIPGQFLDRIKALVFENIDKRAVYWEPSAKNSDLPPPLALERRWPLGRVVRADMERDGGPCEAGKRAYCGSGPDVAFAGNAFSESESMYYRYWLAEAWGSVAADRYGEGRFIEAMEIFSRSVRLAPDRAVWRTNTAVCLAALGRHGEALALVEKAIELNPLSRTAVANGLLYAKTVGDTNTQRRLQRHLRRLEP